MLILFNLVLIFIIFVKLVLILFFFKLIKFNIYKCYVEIFISINILIYTQYFFHYF